MIFHIVCMTGSYIHNKENPMRIFLAIIMTASMSASALAQQLSAGEIAWGNAAAACLERIEPKCEVRTDSPKFLGHPKMWCPSNTPEFAQVQKTCDQEADTAAKPGPAGKWKHREVPQKQGAGYEADDS